MIESRNIFLIQRFFLSKTFLRAVRKSHLEKSPEYLTNT